MSDRIDFLPAAHRRRLANRRAQRERALLAIPVVLALVATDLVLRGRVQHATRMAELAQQHADAGEAAAGTADRLQQQIAGLQAELDTWSAPLAAPRMVQWLDELLAAAPGTVTLRELSCRHRPWASDPAPELRVLGAAATPVQFTDWLLTLQQGGRLPPLSCRRTVQRDHDGGLDFHVESEPVTAVPR